VKFFGGLKTAKSGSLLPINVSVVGDKERVIRGSDKKMDLFVRLGN